MQNTDTTGQVTDEVHPENQAPVKEQTSNAAGITTYHVGYRHPPNRFVKGDRKNPNGRPKKTRPQSHDEALDELLAQKRRVKRKGRFVWVTNRELLMSKIRQEARSGDTDALDQARIIENRIEKAGTMRRERKHIGVMVVPGQFKTTEDWLKVYGRPLGQPLTNESRAAGIPADPPVKAT